MSAQARRGKIPLRGSWELDGIYEVVSSNGQQTESGSLFQRCQIHHFPFGTHSTFLYGVDKAILLQLKKSQKGGQYGNDKSAELYPAFGPHLPENRPTNSLTEHMAEACNSG
jgi:hypothetical protein